MKVQDAAALCKQFCLQAGISAPLFSKPWRPKDREKERIPQEHCGGIYLFSEPPAPEASAKSEDDGGEVWYVGTSSGDIGGRIWTHLGLVTDPATGKVFDPPFKEHNWVSRENIPENVLRVIATGYVGVYTVSIEPLGAAPGWPAVLEKWLLVQSYLLDGRLPLLNASM